MNGDIKSAFKATIPVMMGYIPMGIAFGILFVKTGASWYFAPLMSLLVFAGAAQFIATSVLYAHGSLLTLLFSTLLVNMRHIFYGISFAGRFSNRFIKKCYMIFGLTDESYSILVKGRETHSVEYSFWVILISHAYWVLGSLFGALLAVEVSLNLSFMRFALTALFVVMAIEQAYVIQKSRPFIIAGLAAGVGIAFCLHEMLLFSIGFTVIVFTFEYLLEC